MTIRSSDPVLQDWVCKLEWKKQTVLLEMVRAPDTPITPDIKQIIRFIRSIVLKNADPFTDFMTYSTLPDYRQVERDLERLPLHVVHHILLTLQVVGLESPAGTIADQAMKFYRDAVNAQHLEPESRESYQKRMRTKVSS